ncbi:MAG: GTPase ObgE [Flavobacteriales bacterium]|mgnify:FL=1|nr:GTPase ObgE [Flavobacteriales bacterium]|tara:strand:+ start:2703 stop:3701 length:999 start_codon:yes stop_codon:yes gene_type:complete
MTEGNFVDYVKLHINSGNGGKGSIHLHREKFITKGGPDGGDGGRGGHVIIKGNSNLWTLYNFKFKRHFSAGHGENGSKNRSSGAQGDDVFIEVPIGTVIKNSKTNQIINEITDENKEFILLEGGMGGLGNWHFKSSTRQTPRYAQPGQKGKELDVTLELKILADVGLVGFPNAGKSTLLASLTGAKPKIANYEFTTLKPNLGIVPYRNFKSFVLADIPGIIEGASKGKGLGHYFLRHIERNSILLFMIPCDSKNVKKDFNILMSELKEYNPELLDKDFAIAITKCDLLDNDLIEEYRIEMKNNFEKTPYFLISSISKYGIDRLKDGLWNLLN